MRRAIEEFPNQLRHPLALTGVKKLPRYDNYIVVGMGGSHLGADLVKRWRPDLSIFIHSDYGLPLMPSRLAPKPLVIASSYSGNTEETIDAYIIAGKRKLSRAVITTGGKLLTLAKKDNVPYIQLPNWGIQPRSALGLGVRAFSILFGDGKIDTALTKLAGELPVRTLERRGESLAQKLNKKIPVIYTSTKNRSIGYIWKIKLNETGKIPAFCNVIPELNHNEMAGMAERPGSFHILMLSDINDDLRVQRRMAVTGRMLKHRGMPVTNLPLLGKTIYEQTFTSLLLADWTAFHTAELSGAEADDIPLISKFKKAIAS